MTEGNYTDQIGHQIHLAAPPQRIVSLVPSQTELLDSLSLGPRVVGITRFCVHPPHWRREKKVIGGTKDPDLEKIMALKPDLILANKEENRLEDISWLQERVHVWTSDISDLDDAQDMIREIGRLTDTEAKAEALALLIAARFDTLGAKIPVHKVVYLIWNNPIMIAGTGTFIADMLRRCGCINIVQKTRYPSLTKQELTELDPDTVLLSSEPFPFRQKHIDEFKLLLPRSRFILVDGEFFSWYGARLQHAPAYFARLRESMDEVK